MLTVGGRPPSAACSTLITLFLSFVAAQDVLADTERLQILG